MPAASDEGEHEPFVDPLILASDGALGRSSLRPSPSYVPASVCCQPDSKWSELLLSSMLPNYGLTARGSVDRRRDLDLPRENRRPRERSIMAFKRAKTAVAMADRRGKPSIPVPAQVK